MKGSPINGGTWKRRKVIPGVVGKWWLLASEEVQLIHIRIIKKLWVICYWNANERGRSSQEVEVLQLKADERYARA